MFKTLDIDIDYNEILESYKNLGVEKLLTEANHLKQIAIQCREQTPEDQQLYESCGSLYYDWTKYDATGELPIRTENINETDIIKTCDYFVESYFSHIIKKIQQHGYNVYRGRFMKSLHKTCLTYHTDPTPRLHIPIYTNKNCMMIVDDKVIRLPFGKTYIVDTTLPHTALNASKDSRVHLVFCVDKF
jgi:hypothetical protein